MDLEARSLPVSVKTPLLTKLRDYKVRFWLPRSRLVHASLYRRTWRT